MLPRLEERVRFIGVQQPPQTRSPFAGFSMSWLGRTSIQRSSVAPTGCRSLAFLILELRCHIHSQLLLNSMPQFVQIC